MIRSIVAVILLAGASYGVWWGWSEIALLRRTFWWEYRYLVLLVGAILAYSLAEYIASWFPGDKDDAT